MFSPRAEAWSQTCSKGHHHVLQWMLDFQLSETCDWLALDYQISSSRRPIRHHCYLCLDSEPQTSATVLMCNITYMNVVRWRQGCEYMFLLYGRCWRTKEMLASWPPSWAHQQATLNFAYRKNRTYGGIDPRGHLLTLSSCFCYCVWSRTCRLRAHEHSISYFYLSNWVTLLFSTCSWKTQLVGKEWTSNGT